MRTISTNVFQFDELSDVAKEKAREWEYRNANEQVDEMLTQYEFTEDGERA